MEELTAIRQALDGYLAFNLPALGISSASVSWYNVNFQPVSTELYIRPRIILGDTSLDTLGVDGYQRTNGLYQVTVLGIPNKGVKQLEDMAQAIINLFPLGLTINRNGVEALVRSAYAGAFSTEDIRPVVPVTIDWTMVYKRHPLKEVVL